MRAASPDEPSGDPPIGAGTQSRRAQPNHPMRSNQRVHRFVAGPSTSGWTGPSAVISVWPPDHVTRTLELAGGPSHPRHPTRVRARSPGANSTNPGGMNSSVTTVVAASGSPSRPSGLRPGLPDRRTAWSETLLASSSPVRRPDTALQVNLNATSPGPASGTSGRTASACPVCRSRERPHLPRSGSSAHAALRVLLRRDVFGADGLAEELAGGDEPKGEVEALGAI